MEPTTERLRLFAIVEDKLDECVLGQLCMNAAPPGTVKVIKMYDGGAVLGAEL